MKATVFYPSNKPANLQIPAEGNAPRLLLEYAAQLKTSTPGSIMVHEYLPGSKLDDVPMFRVRFGSLPASVHEDCANYINNNL